MAHYLQQETGAFRLISGTDISTSAPATLQNYTAQATAGGTSTTTNFTIVPGCTLTQGSSGTWLVTGSANFVNTASASQWCLRMTDGTTADASAVIIAEGFAAVPAANLYGLMSLTGIATSPSSQLTLQYTPSSATATAGTTTLALTSPVNQITAVRIG